MTRIARRGAAARTVAEVGEMSILDRLRRRSHRASGVEIGIGDDCAVVRLRGRRLVLTTDTLVEGVHFRSGWDTFAGLGDRAFQVNASDVAAMGADVRFALLSLSVPRSARVRDLEDLIRGFERAARRAGCVLVGGNLTAAPQWVVGVTVIGEAVAVPLTRSGARPGDGLWVSGTIGGAARARELLLAGKKAAPRETRAFRRPTARLSLGRALARRRLASAAIDLSDGLIQDLGHLCRASRVGAVVEADGLPLPAPLRRLPRDERLRLALGSGEDYELLFTAPARAERSLKDLGTPVRKIGRIERGRGVRVIAADGRELPLDAIGFDHFSRGARLR